MPKSFQRSYNKDQTYGEFRGFDLKFQSGKVSKMHTNIYLRQPPTLKGLAMNLECSHDFRLCVPARAHIPRQRAAAAAMQ